MASVCSVIVVALIIAGVAFIKCRGRFAKIADLERQVTTLKRMSQGQAYPSMVEVTIDEPLVSSGPEPPEEAPPPPSPAPRGLK